MKKQLLALALLPALAVNAQTVKKVMLEDFTGAWCQYCPNGSNGIRVLDSTYPTKFIAVASHNDGGNGPSADLLAITEGDDVATGIGVTGFPTGAVDRKLITGGKIPIGINANADQWKSAVAGQMATTAIASVSFSNLKKNANGTYEGDINVRFTSAPTSGVPLKYNVYILENKIPAEGSLQQRNVTQWYGGPGASPAIWTTTTSSGNKFYHDHTLRAALGGTWGWDVVTPPSNVSVGTVYTKHFTITIPATAVPAPWVKANLEVVGFVAYNGTAASDQKQVLNAEKITINAFSPAGVSTVTNGVNILSAYPNPAKATDVVNIEFNINNSEKVTMNVFDATGKLVAQPYISEDVKGAHTILWRPSEDGLTPGMYMIQVSTSEGSATQRISIQ